MEKQGTKLLKLALFVGVLAYLLYYDVNRGAFSVGTVTGGLMMASAAYLIASLFGLILNLSGNYLIAMIGTGALALFCAFKLDDVIAKIPWLTDTMMAAILIILTVLCIIKDFVAIKKSFTVSKAAVPAECREKTPMTDDANLTMREGIKANPESVLNLSNMLEKQWGRKPTYDEIMDYIDHLAIPEDGV